MARKQKTTAAPEDLIEQIVGRYDAEVGMLIPMMQDLQAECGYLPADDLRRLAARLEVPLSRLYAIATFYASFRLSPKGHHEVTLCVGTVCYLKGSGAISEMIRKEFRVEGGGTTPDGLFSFMPVNCVGACALAPVMIVDGRYYDGVTAASALDLLRKLPAEEETGERKAKA
ncbi:MAG: NAD(P)H-dependent oxidoreductase subunit E [Planctomycetota bacterium]|nr:NAD(P)H-dependent oxidoreductase subunit E [Planctomycetota bacterium]